ncbi:MAG: hypothetical protein NXH70_02715 [Hyphomonas sp.]|nr:hypothetical protein [Hyphomonas sp.]
MKDLVELFEDQDRDYRSDWVSDERRCQSCRGFFSDDELVSVENQVIDGRLVDEAEVCINCVSEETD